MKKGPVARKIISKEQFNDIKLGKSYEVVKGSTDVIDTVGQIQKIIKGEDFARKQRDIAEISKIKRDAKKLRDAGEYEKAKYILKKAMDTDAFKRLAKASKVRLK